MAAWANKQKGTDSKGIPIEFGILIARAVPEGVIILTPRHNVYYMNPLAERMVTMSLEDATGLNIHSVLHLADKNAEILSPDNNPVERALKTKQPFASKMFSVLSAGAKVPITLVVAPDAASNYTVITFRDIESELRMQESASELISVASHELRTPMTAIEGYISLAMNPATATIDERGRYILDKAHREVGRLGALFTDLLDAAKINDGKLVLSLIPMDITPIVNEAISRFRPIAQKQGLHLEKTGDTDLTPQFIASVDANALSEILDNLIGNAVKYTKNGSISVSITGDDKNIRVTVTDTGIGVSPDDLRHIFEKFYRAGDEMVREAEGTGLGLYLSTERAKAMHGAIMAESKQGQGSQFTLILPRKQNTSG